MRKFALLSLCLALVFGARSAAAQQTPARAGDLERLQDEVVTLEDTLQDVPPNHPREAEFRNRAEEIRENVTYLKVQVRRNQRNRGEGLGASLDDIAWVRQDIRRLQDDVYDALNLRHSGGQAALREGTEIQVRLDQPLSSATARLEDRVEATVITPVRLDNRVLIPTGTRVRGVVRRVEQAQRPARGGTLDLAFNTLLYDDNTRLDLSARVVAVRESMDRNEGVHKAGIGAALGAVLGSVLGGRKGALVGILVGGTGGLAASKGEDVDMPEGTILSLTLDRPLTVRR